ncbi:BREX-1 system adenine-specific DNA-methyltransferase PglX [Ruminococcus sp. XPD3002]|uniref:BREX-1 system adenine-specific DNA-methyltransferase PglX n=1 Tax=Ruminococcus sp. XPD3002 TaxID=1452269 RepID=UPI0009121BD1|nr:Methyltransferase domain-containing protein [Ruminococcus flavefaciens]
MNKTSIKNFAIAARLTLIDAVTQRAFEYEVTENGKNTPDQTEVNGKALTPTELSQRRQLIDRIRQNGFAKTMEEAAYTWFNRFIALRFMEVNGYLPMRIRVFTDENNSFKPEILAEASRIELDGIDHDYIMDLLDAQQNDTLYKYLLIAQCNALNTGLPEMFEEIGGWTELLFPNNLLRNDSVIAHMVEDIPEDDWKDQVQIIGWLYQYYNTEPKDKVFADLKKNIKISAEAIPAATQLFTPDWIVRYMVENSLGRLWTEGHGKPENADWKYYLEEAEQEESVKAELEKLRAEYKSIQPEQIKVIDPCMGSGHILVYAFDVLMAIYTSCGWSERDAALSILQHNLYGLDIDRRAYQLAYFAVMMKARQYNRSIIKNGEVQPQLANFADVMGVDTSLVSGKIRDFAEQFKFADTYGSLMEIKAPDGLDEAVSEFDVSFGISRRQLDMMLRIYKNLSQKYDVVVTNPPYMGGSGMNATLSDYVKKIFPDSKSDLFACFMEKAYQLAKQSGFTSLITMESWMFLSSFEDFRKRIYDSKTIINMVHMPYLGKGGTSLGINFGTAAVVTQNRRICNYNAQYECIVYYETDDEGVPFVFPTINKRWKTAKQENFSKIPGMTVAYWVSDSIRKAFSVGKPIDEIASPRQGMATSDNDRFLRLWYEIDSHKLGLGYKNREEAMLSRKKWFPYNKGGPYRKWYGNACYVVNWQNDGEEIKKYREYKNSTLTSNMGVAGLPFIFKENVTWSKVTSGKLSVRYLPEGFLFDVSGCSIYSKHEVIYIVMALLNSSVAELLVSALSQTINYEVGSIKAIPMFDLNFDCQSIVNDNIRICKDDWNSFETSWDFEEHPLI